MPHAIVTLLLVATLLAAAPIRTDAERERLEKQWGIVDDVEKDTVVRLDGDALHLGLPGKRRALVTEAGVTNAPRVLREINGDFKAEVHVLGRFPDDARSVTDGRAPFYCAGILLWQDERNYVRLERARGHVGQPARWICSAGFTLRRDGKYLDGTMYEHLLDPEKSVHLRLTRKGASLAASYSEDGKEWNELPALESEFPAKVRVGVFAVQNTPSGYTATFERLKVAATAPMTK
jgi:regulation of enolase protein 1 (concanavalin A-like superfamily)